MGKNRDFFLVLLKKIKDRLWIELMGFWSIRNHALKGHFKKAVY